MKGGKRIGFKRKMVGFIRMGIHVCGGKRRVSKAFYKKNFLKGFFDLEIFG